MKEQDIIKSQLIKNMLLNLIAFTIIFYLLGIILYTEVANSLYKSSDKELLNYKNRSAIIKKIDENLENRELPTPTDINKTSNNQEDKLKGMNAPNPRLLYIFRDKNGDIIEEKGRYSEEYFEEVSFDENATDEIYNVIVNGEYKYRGVNYKIEEDEEVSYIQVLINVDAEQSILKDFTTTLVIVIIVSITLSIIASYILSKKTLNPIISSWKKQTEFVQNASHELRTPLTIIQAKQELLLENPNSKIIDKAKDINTVLNETRRLSKLTKDLMALARADSNKMEISKEKTDIDKLVKDVSEPFNEIAKSQGKEFLLDLKYDKLINIDRNKIHQLIIIVLDNCIKYTQKKEQIKITSYKKDSKFILEISDTGIGVSDEGLEHIFDRFYREDKARSRQTGGSGLGLSIANLIVNEHGGSIKVEHNNPKGTKIIIKLK